MAGRVKELVSVADMITPGNFAHEREIGDVYGWCERIQEKIRSAATRLSTQAAELERAASAEKSLLTQQKDLIQRLDSQGSIYLAECELRRAAEADVSRLTREMEPTDLIWQWRTIGDWYTVPGTIAEPEKYAKGIAGKLGSVRSLVPASSLASAKTKMIPNEAVEAAKAAIRANFDNPTGDYTDLSEDEMKDFITNVLARAALEAALPYLLGERTSGESENG